MTMPGIKGIRTGCTGVGTPRVKHREVMGAPSLAGMHVNVRASTVALFRARTRNEDARNRDGRENSCESRHLPMVREIDSS